MASLFNHPRSRFFFVQYRTKGGKVRRESLKIEKGSELRRRLAQQEVAKYTVKELESAVSNPRAVWSAWVDDFLYQKYQDRPKTLLRYQGCWKTIEKFLHDRGLIYPSQIRYKYSLDYMAWRKAGGKHHNTARLEMILLGLVMREAVRREFATANPLAELGIAKIRPPLKPEMTDKDIQTIRDALKVEDEWMQVAFEIALFTGCRLSETRIAMKDIDFDRRLITFQKPKGGEEKAFTTRFSGDLLPLLQRLTDGRTYTLTFPQEDNAYPNISSNHWHRFFQGIKESLSDPNITFHSTRVTFITRHARARTDERVVKKLVNHSSTLVHQIYSRLKPEDVLDSELQVGLPRSSD